MGPHVSLKGRSLYKSLPCTDVMRAGEGRANSPNKDRGYKRGVGNVEGLEVRGQGSGRHSALGGLLTCLWRRSLPGRASQTVDPRKQGPWETINGWM